MIETFTKEAFEKVLDENFENWLYDGMGWGEHMYKIPYRGIFVHIRSSIHEDNISASTGEDSIRMVITDESGSLLGKVSAYTTRVSGWQSRMVERVHFLFDLRDKSGNCPDCGNPLHIFEVKKDGPNHGRLFAKCNDQEHNIFVWLDKPSSPVFAFIPEEKENAIAKQEEEEHEVPNDKKDEEDLKEFLASLPDEEGDLQSETLYEVVEIQKKAPPIELNEQQAQSVFAPFDKPLRVLAGAGSGKTACLSRRYAAMVDSGINPNSIVAVTFNKLMAQELLIRIMALTPIPPDAQNQICTIHALCYRVLKSFLNEYRKAKVAPDYIVKKTLEKILAELEPDSENRPAWEEVYSWICTAKSNYIAPAQTARWFSNVCENSFYCNLLQDSRIALSNQLAEAGYITFPDMLYDVEYLLNNDNNFVTFLQSRFKYLIVDESQDTGHQAIRILQKIFSHTNYVTFVGDPDQLLYRFAGATPENNLYEGFEERYPDNTTVMLPINYRSTKKIVSTGLKCIVNNYEPYGPYEVKYLKSLATKPNASEGFDIHYTSALNPIEESRNFVDEIKRMIELGRKPEDFFVAARTRAQIGYMEAAFAPSGIPYVNVVGTSFFDLQHVKHVLAYMRIVGDTNNSESFKEIVNIASNQMTVPWKNAPDYGNYCYHRFLTAEFVATAKTYSNMIRMFNDRNLRYAWMPGMRDISDLMSELFAASDGGPDKLFDAILDLCYRKYIQALTGNADTDLGDCSKLDDLLTLRDFAKQFVNLKDFLQFVDSVIAATKAAQSRDWSGRVVLSTIHRLKGLERPVVFGAGMSEGIGADSYGNLYGLLPHTFSLTEPINNGKLPGAGKGRVEDERCLFYVLVTRAKEFVLLSSLETYRDKPMMPSRFLKEIQ